MSLGNFFFLREDDLRNLGQLVVVAGMDVTDERLLEPDEPSSRMVAGPWGPVLAEGRLAKYAYHRCLEILLLSARPPGVGGVPTQAR
ncbi:MAG TPA: hypothetical protein VIA06_14800 [Candidatus Dormibacteraeota bacterium]|nr:hypothetical protein [Candidatus Dormibacteraeota bacterium]